MSPDSSVGISKWPISEGNGGDNLVFAKQKKNERLENKQNNYFKNLLT